MRNFLLLSLLVISFSLSGQQHLNFNATHQFSSLKFLDSNGVKADVTPKFSYGYAFSYEKVFKSIFIRPELGYRNNGAYANPDNIHVEWDFNYIDLNLSVGYRYDFGKFEPQISIGFYEAFLLNGKQKIGFMQFDLLEINAVEQVDFGINAEIGCRVEISEKSALFFGYRHSFGLAQLEISDTSQELYHRFGALNLGFSYKLSE